MEVVEAERPRVKPQGGFTPIKVWLLAATYWSYLTGRIPLRAVRVFLALHEMQARRCTLEQGRAPTFNVEELRGLVGGQGDLRRDIRALERLGLARVRKNSITWPKSVEDLSLPLDEFHEWFSEHFQNRARTVPLPRPLIRFLAGAGTKSLIAGVLGHAIRMLYLRNNQVEPRGRCKASWVASAFGIDLSSAERARARMLELGLLVRGGDSSSKERWCERRWGGCFYWNLGWSAGLPVRRDTGTQEAPGAESEAQTAQKPDTGLRGVSHKTTTDLRGVESDKHPSLREEYKNQQPTSGRPGAGVSKKEELGKPRIAHIEEADLENTTRLLELHVQAERKELVGSSEADRLRFVALAEHAHAYGTTNRGGLFAKLLGVWGTSPRWHFITQADEDRARERLKEHFFDREEAKHRPELRKPSTGEPGPSRTLSDDARFVQLVKRTLAQRGITGDVLRHVQRFRPEWTEERWGRASAELRGPKPMQNESPKRPSFALDEIIGRSGHGS